MISVLRRFSTVEGISTLVLFLVAMPLKYLADMPLAVRIVGMGHGVLFIAYCILLALCMRRFKWSIGFGIYLFVATLIPFGTFVTDRRLKQMES